MTTRRRSNEWGFGSGVFVGICLACGALFLGTWWPW